MNNFETLRRKISEKENKEYESYSTDFESSKFITGRPNETLLSWYKVLFDLIEVTETNENISNKDEWWLRMKASGPVSIEDNTDKLSVFSVMNTPADMGSPLISRLVISDKDDMTSELLTKQPFLVLWSGPSGPYAGESPLMYQEDSPEKWIEEVEFAMESIKKSISERRS